MIPGEIITQSGDIDLNSGAATLKLEVANTGDRPIQVGSHYHFFETNEALNLIVLWRAACALTLPQEPPCALSRASAAR